MVYKIVDKIVVNNEVNLALERRGRGLPRKEETAMMKLLFCMY
jgi:hypothetical protein